jgi:hypothetical protein
MSTAPAVMVAATKPPEASGQRLANATLRQNAAQHRSILLPAEISFRAPANLFRPKNTVSFSLGTVLPSIARISRNCGPYPSHVISAPGSTQAP